MFPPARRAEKTLLELFFFVIVPFLWRGGALLSGSRVKRFAPASEPKAVFERWAGAVARLSSLRPLAAVSPHLASGQVHCALVPL